MSKNTETLKEIKNLDPSILESAGIIARAKHGYICPFCGNGSGKDGTGLEPKPIRDCQENGGQTPKLKGYFNYKEDLK